MYIKYSIACAILFPCFFLLLMAFFFSLQGDYEKAGMYYMASVKENNKPLEFVLPYYGL